MIILSILWNLLFIILIPISIPIAIYYFWYRTAELRERLGLIKADISENDSVTWFHVASIGEANSLLYFLNLYTLNFKNEKIILTAMTETGVFALKKLFPDCTVFFFPLPFYFPINSFFRKIKPDRIFLTEGELWLDMLLIAKIKKIPVIMLNAQISEKTLAKYTKLKILSKATFLNINHYFAISRNEKDKLISIGVDNSKIDIVGTTKADVMSKPKGDMSFYKDEGKLIITLGSVRPEEEEVFMRIIKKVFENINHIRCVWIPRYPDKIDKLTKILLNNDLKISLFSGNKKQKEEILIVDALGKLMDFYAISDITFVGGTFSTGGHNILEPASLSKPVIVGPVINKIRSIAEVMQEKEGIIISKDEIDASNNILVLINSPEKRKKMGENAFKCFSEIRGASEKTIDLIKKSRMNKED